MQNQLGYHSQPVSDPTH